MSGIEAKRDGDKVRITVRIGEKTARLGVTPEYARALAAELLDAAGDESKPSSVRDMLKRALERHRASQEQRGEEFLDQVADILTSKGAA